MASERADSPGSSRQFPGLGILRCRLCDRPLRDHDGPCPMRVAEAADAAGAALTAATGRTGRLSASADPFHVDWAIGTAGVDAVSDAAVP